MKRVKETSDAFRSDHRASERASCNLCVLPGDQSIQCLRSFQITAPITAKITQSSRAPIVMRVNICLISRSGNGLGYQSCSPCAALLPSGVHVWSAGRHGITDA
ncbi:hypothetical protein BaRGS_00037526 [Batillaria attramentaria]|uniref:Uncharacterized protein n=1 Tax=Batillaria attramentaria TaxID=370345 RepID=A0ABD0J8W7_9CAEN